MIRYRWRPAGAHVRVVVSAGPDRDHLAHTGVLTLAPDEWEDMRGLLADAAVDGGPVEVIPDDGQGDSGCQHEESIPAGDPRYAGFRIETVWAWLGVDPADDQQGIIVIPGYGPALATDERRLEDLRPIVERYARDVAMRVELARFDRVPVDPQDREGGS